MSALDAPALGAQQAQNLGIWRQGWHCAECIAQQEYWGGNKSAPDLPGRTDTSSQLVFNLDSISKPGCSDVSEISDLCNV